MHHRALADSGWEHAAMALGGECKANWDWPAERLLVLEHGSAETWTGNSSAAFVNLGREEQSADALPSSGRESHDGARPLLLRRCARKRRRCALLRAAIDLNQLILPTAGEMPRLLFSTASAAQTPGKSWSGFDPSGSVGDADEDRPGWTTLGRWLSHEPWRHPENT